VEADVDHTIATVVPVRGETTVQETAAAVVARVSVMETVSTSERGLARLSLDQGPRLLLDRESEVEPADGGSVALRRGRVFVETQPGEQLSLLTEAGSLRAQDAAFSVRVADATTHVYVVRGDVSWTRGDERGIAASGETLELSEDGAHTEAATLWHDWTGGLARPGPTSSERASGVGTLEARVPDQIGRARWPLVIRRLDVRVRIVGDLAVTEVDQLFFNPASETVEGLYRIKVPDGAVLQRFAVDRDERLVDGYVRERAQARAAYQAQVYRGSTEDPALLEWDAPSAYRARIYPIAPGATRRIVIRYAEWLRPPAGGTARLYRYPMSGGARAPHIQEFALSVDVAEAGAISVRAGMGATVEEGAVRIRRSDFRARADFWLELVGGEGATQRAWTAAHSPPARAPDARDIPNEADERDYFYLPLVLPASLSEARHDAVDLVILADVSAATDRSHLELGRSVVESLLAHLDADDRVAVVSADLTIRSVDGAEPELGSATPERVERLLDGLARVPAGGATDLGEAVASAAALLDPERHGAIVYVGDGAPTVGELRAEGLIERFARLPEPARLYAVAIGSDANLELLESLTRGGGLSVRVDERAQAADTGLRILTHAGRPTAHGVEVDLGTGIENSFPRRPMGAVLGEVFPVTGRVRDGLPTSVTVTGTIDGEPFTHTVAVETQTTAETTDLRLRWAGERLRELINMGAGREEVAELGTRYGLITPFTSYYVPSRRELSQMGPHALRWLDQPLLQVGGHHSPAEEIAAGAMTLALGPLALAGCASQEANFEAEEEVPEWLDESDDDEGGSAGRHRGEEGAMGEASSERTANRFGIEGPGGNSAPQMAREQARQQAQGQPAPEAPMEESENAGAVGVLRSLNGSWNSPTSPYGSDTATGGTEALGNDPMSAIGALAGDEIGSNFGFGGLGLRGTGRGGGGTGEGTIGLGNLGTIGGGGGGTAADSGYGRGAGGRRGRTTRVPRVRLGNPDVRGVLSREVIRRVVRRHVNEVRFCYEQELNQRPDLEGRVTMSFIISPTGSVQSASATSSTLSNSAVETCSTQAVRRWTFPAPDGGGVVGVNLPFTFESVGGGRGSAQPTRAAAARAEPAEAEGPRIITHIVHTTDDAAHRRRRCSDAAYSSLADRRALWSERLRGESSAAGWVRLYRLAIRNCEAERWLGRRTFLSAILARAGSVQAMTQVYGLMDGASARVYLRSRILRRVRTPEDLRAVRGAFGLGRGVDWALVEQILGRARTDRAKVGALRRLTMQYPRSFELKLRLLALLERTDREGEAKRLADRMRADPLADPGVRTAVGEMFLRMGREEEARRVFSEMVEFAPLDELARRRLGDIYRAHGWFEDAYRQYQTLAEIRPDDRTVQLLLAQAAAGAGRVDEALRLERALMQTAEPGAARGIARTALLWSSVRFARLRRAAREQDDDERLEELSRWMRRSGVLREAGELRVTLVWSHPDAELSLWAGLPGLPPTRPRDLSPEYGLEAFDLAELEPEPYRFEVRRQSNEDDLTEVSAQLIVVWNEGEDDEQIEIVDLTFDREHPSAEWTLQGRALTPTSGPAQGT